MSLCDRLTASTVARRPRGSARRLRDGVLPSLIDRGSRPEPEPWVCGRWRWPRCPSCVCVYVYVCVQALDRYSCHGQPRAIDIEGIICSMPFNPKGHHVSAPLSKWSSTLSSLTCFAAVALDTLEDATPNSSTSRAPTAKTPKTTRAAVVCPALGSTRTSPRPAYFGLRPEPR